MYPKKHSEAKPKCQSLEQRSTYCRVKQREWVADIQKIQWFWGKSFYSKMWSEGCRVCDFLLIDWWLGNRGIFQKFCAQPEITILHPRGGLSSCRRTKDILFCISLEKDPGPILSLHIISWLFIVFSF